jgi:hypothetical protein
LAAFLVQETDSLFTAVFFACQSFKLAARQRVKGMRDPELLGLCSMNRCSLTLLPITCDIPNSWRYEKTKIRGRSSGKLSYSARPRGLGDSENRQAEKDLTSSLLHQGDLVPTAKRTNPLMGNQATRSLIASVPSSKNQLIYFDL